MNLIFIANIAEISLQLVQFLEKTQAISEIDEDHALSDRFLFSDEDDRILITPYLIEKSFLEESLRVLKFNNVKNWAPKNINGSICDAILADKNLWKKIISVISDNPGIKIAAYSGTKEFYFLVNKLRELGLNFRVLECPTDDNKWTQEYFGSKAGFRQAVLALGKNFPAMPTGIIAGSRDEVVGWAKYFLEEKGGVVIKFNHGLAGAGLKIILKKEIKGDIENFLKELVDKEKYFQAMPVVVEEKIEGEDISIEVKVTDKEVEFLYGCGMRVTSDGMFQGVEIGSGVSPKKLKMAGKRLGIILKKFGYRGFFDCDMVMNKAGKIFPLEANLRRTGGTHVWEMARRLLGKNNWQKFYLVANNGLTFKSLKVKSYKDIKDIAGELFFDKNKMEGVVVTVVGLISKKRLGYVVIGKNKKRTYAIEKEFLRRLG